VPGGAAPAFDEAIEGETPRGWWKITAITPPSTLSFRDGFADENGNPVDDMPMSTVEVELTEQDVRTRMELRSRSESRESMERLVEMGAVEGMAAAMGQMDAILAEN